MTTSTSNARASRASRFLKFDAATLAHPLQVLDTAGTPTKIAGPAIFTEAQLADLHDEAYRELFAARPDHFHDSAHREYFGVSQPEDDLIERNATLAPLFLASSIKVVGPAIDSMTDLADKSGNSQAIITAALEALTKLHNEGFDVSSNGFTDKAMSIRDIDGIDNGKGGMKLGEEGSLSYRRAACQRASLSVANKALRASGTLSGKGDDESMNEAWSIKSKNGIKTMVLAEKAKPVESDLMTFAKLYDKDNSNTAALDNLRKALTKAENIHNAHMGIVGNLKDGIAAMVVASGVTISVEAINALLASTTPAQ